LLEHTADVGLEAWGATPGEAFALAAHGMFAIMLGTDPRDGVHPPAVLVDVQVEGHDWEDLLVSWLAELLYRLETEWFVPVRIAVQACEPPWCLAHLEGYRLARGEPLGGSAIKAITYHQLQVTTSGGRTDVRVIFDI
jgi:SHS2 domain-containing protein